MKASFYDVKKKEIVETEVTDKKEAHAGFRVNVFEWENTIFSIRT